jgi:hypothetical protein
MEKETETGFTESSVQPSENKYTQEKTKTVKFLKREKALEASKECNQVYKVTLENLAK